MAKKKQEISYLKSGSKGPGRVLLSDIQKHNGCLIKSNKSIFKAKDRTKNGQPLVCKECRSAVVAFTNAQKMISSGNFPNRSLHQLYLDCYKNEADAYKDTSIDEDLSHRPVSPLELDFLAQTPNSFMALGANPLGNSSGIELNARNSSVTLIPSSYSMGTPKEPESYMSFWKSSQMSMSAPVETPVRNENYISQASVAQADQDSLAGSSNFPMLLQSDSNNRNAMFFNQDGLRTIYGPRSGGSLRAKSSLSTRGSHSSKLKSPSATKTPKNGKSKFDFYN